MNLGEIRTQFGALSGRLDLIAEGDDGSVGADVYIKQGSKMLDRMADIESSHSVVFRTVEAGDYYLEVSNVRAIHEVWLYTGGKTFKLKEGTKEQLRGYFPGLLANSDRGIPAWYHTANMRVDELSDTSLEGFLNHVDFSGEYYNGIIFPQVADEGIFEIDGNFYSTELINSTDENYWSVENPFLLVWAALYHMEVSYRNSEGAKDWMAAITQNLTMLEFDHVEQGAINLRQMGGREND